MDRLISMAWRAFWVGLGASAVLITQSVLTPPPGPAAPDGDAPAPAEMAPAKKTPDRILSGHRAANRRPLHAS